MFWLLFALGAAFFFGVGQVFIKKGYAHFSPLWNAIIDAVFSIILYVPLALLLGASLQFTFFHFFMIFVIAGLYIFFYYAIEHGELSLSGTIFSSYPAITIALSLLFLHEKITPTQAAMLFLILSGVLLLNYEPGALKDIRKAKTKTWLLWALFGAFTTGLADFFAKVTLNAVETNTYLILFAISFVLSSTVFWIFDKKGRSLPKNITFQNTKWTLMGTAMLSLGVLCITYAFSLGNASLVAPISASYIGITVLLSYFFLKESLTKRQILAICMIAIGVAFIGS